MTARFGLDEWWAADEALRQIVGEWLATLNHRDVLAHRTPCSGPSIGPAVDLIEWDGESYRVRGWPPGFPTDPETGDAVRRWITPASPPPLEALRFALAQRLNAPQEARS